MHTHTHACTNPHTHPSLEQEASSNGTLSEVKSLPASLIHLGLAHNVLQQLPPDLAHCGVLERLDVHANR